LTELYLELNLLLIIFIDPDLLKYYLFAGWELYSEKKIEHHLELAMEYNCKAGFIVPRWTISKSKEELIRKSSF
jgi:hypothetical protein